MNNIQKTMIEKFQCPGCTCGSSTDDGCFKESEASLACKNHSAGTFISDIGCVNLGLPNGFNHNGPVNKRQQHSIIRLFETLPEGHYNKFNVPVWVMEYEGYLFVRCYLPLTNRTFVDVIKNGKICHINPGALPIDVNDFIEEIN